MYYSPKNIYPVLIMKSCVETLVNGLAMGADKAVHVSTDLEIDADVQPIHVAKILNKYLADNDHDLVILGKQAIDGDYNQTGQMLSYLSNRDMATFISKVCIVFSGF